MVLLNWLLKRHVHLLNWKSGLRYLNHVSVLYSYFVYGITVLVLQSCQAGSIIDGSNGRRGSMLSTLGARKPASILLKFPLQFHLIMKPA